MRHTGWKRVGVFSVLVMSLATSCGQAEPYACQNRAVELADISGAATRAIVDAKTDETARLGNVALDAPAADELFETTTRNTSDANDYGRYRENYRDFVTIVRALGGDDPDQRLIADLTSVARHGGAAAVTRHVRHQRAAPGSPLASLQSKLRSSGQARRAAGRDLTCSGST